MKSPLRALSFRRHRFPEDVIRQAVWLDYRFTLSFRDVEVLLAQRGIEVSYETITRDKMASYGAAVRELGPTGCHRPGGMCEDNRAENSGIR